MAKLDLLPNFPPTLKHNITALSTCVAEYIAATSTAQQTRWIRRMLKDTHIAVVQADSPEDGQSVRNTRSEQHGPDKAAKFIDLLHLYATHQSQKGTIAISHVPTDEQLATSSPNPSSAKHSRASYKSCNSQFNRLQTPKLLRRGHGECHESHNNRCRRRTSMPL